MRLVYWGFLLFPLLFGTTTKEIEPSVSIAPFKNNALGAYTLIHDDFGGQWAHGIEDFADSIAFNRNIPFCFAAITSECDGEDWQTAKRMISHRHQIVNHSMYHKCGKEESWCQAGFWDETDFPIEIDKSTQLIEKNTGMHPAFFMFPFDLHTDTMLSYLKSKGFCGARAGVPGICAITSPETDFYRLNFRAYPPGKTIDDLNNYCLEAESKNGWAIQEIHGIDDQSWSSISSKDYRSHIDFLKNQTFKNLIWVGTLSDVLYYTLLNNSYHAVITSTDSQKRVTEIAFQPSNTIETPAIKAIRNRAMVTTSLKNLTIVITQHSSKVVSISQQDKKLLFRLDGDHIIFDANPNEGAIKLVYV